MNTEERKAAIAAYKERKAIAGIYAVRCVTAGALWIGHTPNLEMIQNRIWFTLRAGNHPVFELQKLWNTCGPHSFLFEELERLKPEKIDYLQYSELKQRAEYWRSKYVARPM